MADNFMVGRKPGSDKYMVGWNKTEANSNAYRVGNSKSGPGQASKSVGGDQDSVVGGKSAFSYSDPSLKDPGDKSENMNFGGGESAGVPKASQKAGGEIDLVYTEKGDYQKAMKKRIDNMEAYAKGDGYNSPVPQVDSK